MIDFALLGIIAVASGIGMGHIINSKEILNVDFITEKKFGHALKTYNVNLSKEAQCQVCGKDITKNNLGEVVHSKDKDIFICDNDDCIIIGDDIKHYT